jgi:16S rRNA (cytidine1402-2'-O)-methyltransferase
MSPPRAVGGTRGTLYVVSTPIGNLADVTLRALEVLGAVAVIAAEDTRVSRRLLDRHGIAARLVSYHARNAAGRGPQLLARLRDGEDVALVTDAGTPGVSDPGEALVASWAAEGGGVVPVPGASSVTAALAAAGIAGPRWSFEGFLPRSGRERRARLAALAAEGRGAVLFEAPGRLAATLADLAGACGPDRPGAVCRELTKVHEEVIRGTLGDLAARAAAGAIDPRGEATVVIGWWRPAGRAGPAGTEAGTSDAAGSVAGSPTGTGPGAALEEAIARARARVAELVTGGSSRSEAARLVAAETGLPRRLLYRADTGS